MLGVCAESEGFIVGISDAVTEPVVDGNMLVVCTGVFDDNTEVDHADSCTSCDEENNTELLPVQEGNTVAVGIVDSVGIGCVVIATVDDCVGTGCVVLATVDGSVGMGCVVTATVDTGCVVMATVDDSVGTTCVVMATVDDSIGMDFVVTATDDDSVSVYCGLMATVDETTGACVVMLTADECDWLSFGNASETVESAIIVELTAVDVKSNVIEGCKV